MDPSLDFFRSFSENCDINVTVDSRRLDQLRGSFLFDSGSVWKLSSQKQGLLFDFASPVFGQRPYKQLRISRDFRVAHLSLNSEFELTGISPLEYPADELLFTNYLAHHGLGVEVHGGGLIDPDHGGFLFLGHSGAGKSTTTRLWKSSRDPEILSDDRIILRLHDGELWMYGTPWHGEAAYASPAKEKLSKIFILQHGQGNHFREMGKVEAAGELFARTFPPFHSAQGLESTVEFLSRVVHTVPCYEFQFLPDRSAVDSVLHFNG
jgi:hypothetical protein